MNIVMSKQPDAPTPPPTKGTGRPPKENEVSILDLIDDHRDAHKSDGRKGEGK